jgi:hypothetical protein
MVKSVPVPLTENSNNNNKRKLYMRKRVKTTIEETREYGAICLENWLLVTILGFAKSPEITQDHINTMVTRAVKLSEDGKGRTLTVADDLVALAIGTPMSDEAVRIASTAV